MVESILKKYYSLFENENSHDNQSGRLLWEKLVAQKIDDLINERFPLPNLTQRLMHINGVTGFSGVTAEQFPSYSFPLELDRWQVNGFQRDRTLWIDISLLEDLVTFFVEDRLSCQGISNAIGGRGIPPVRYIYNQAASEGRLVNILSAVKTIIAEELPNFTILGHLGLFEQKFRVAPFEQYGNTVATVFDLLFSKRYEAPPNLVHIWL